MSSTVAKTLGSISFGSNSTSPILDPTLGGQAGYSAQIQYWQSNQPYVRKRTFAILMQAPAFFMENSKDGPKLVAMLKAFFETRARTIEGLSSGVSLEFDSTPVGYAGQIQEEAVKATRATSEPVIGVQELAGRPFQKLFEYWITYGIMSPDTQFALKSDIGKGLSDVWLAHKNTATVLFIEPDPGFTYVEKAWLCTNMRPRNNGDVIGSSDQTGSGELLTLSIPFTAITDTTLGTLQLAQKLLDELKAGGADPNKMTAFLNKVDSDVSAVDNGIKKDVSVVVDSAVDEDLNP